jgi:hypothetical protein
MPFSPVPFNFDGTMPEGFYPLRWRQPGRADADFGRYDIRRVVRTIYVLFSGSEVPIAKEGQETMDLADDSTPLPEWFTQEDLDEYASLYEKSGFGYPIRMPYRYSRSSQMFLLDFARATPILGINEPIAFLERAGL